MMTWRKVAYSADCGDVRITPRSERSLFDHLVGAGDQWGWHFKAEDLRGFQINNQFEFGRLLYRKIGSFFTFQNTTNVSPSLMKYVKEIRSIAKQATGTNVLRPRVRCGDAITGGQSYDLFALRLE
jgi:hypothetical protein